MSHFSLTLEIQADIKRFLYQPQTNVTILSLTSILGVLGVLTHALAMLSIFLMLFLLDCLTAASRTI